MAEAQRGSRRWPLYAAAAAVLFVSGLVVQQMSLRDFRRIETDYVASRQVTACANQSLIPLAFGEQDDMDVVLEAVVTAAAEEIRLVRGEFRAGGDVFPFPPLRAAHRAVEDALDEQVDLYDALVVDPANSDDELESFGERYARAERSLARARNALLVGEGRGWARRAVCRDPPPDVRGE